MPRDPEERENEAGRRREEIRARREARRREREERRQKRSSGRLPSAPKEKEGEEERGAPPSSDQKLDREEGAPTPPPAEEAVPPEPEEEAAERPPGGRSGPPPDEAGLRLDGWLFKARIPSNRGRPVTMLQGPVLDPRREARPVLTLERRPLKGSTQPDQVLQQRIMQLVKELPRYAPLDVWRTELQGRPGWVVGAAYEGRLEGTLLRELRLLVIDGGELVEVTGTVRLELWPRAAPMFETFLHTLSFEPVKGQPKPEAGLGPRQRMHPEGEEDGPVADPAPTEAQAWRERRDRVALGLPLDDEEVEVRPPAHWEELDPVETGEAAARLERLLRATRPEVAATLDAHQLQAKPEGLPPEQLDRFLRQTHPGESPPKEPPSTRDVDRLPPPP